MSGLINKVKDAVHGDKHSDTTGYSNTSSTTGSSGAYTTTGDNRGFDGPATRTDGPHSSNIANKADPRVDSDRDYSRNMGANPSGTATTGGYSGGRTTEGYSATSGTESSAFGSSRQTEGYSGGLTGRSEGYAATSGTIGGDDRGVDGPATRTDGPHSSNLANKADPRVDSDRDYSRNMGANPSGTATTGGDYSSRGGSTLNSTTTGGATYNSSGPGPAPNTAGPHKSDMLNKADPRVDSDLDGSKVYGGNKTYSQSGSNTYAGRDPTDATQVPPSIMKKHIGDPEIHHDDHSHGREERHSVSHQETHRGL